MAIEEYRVKFDGYVDIFIKRSTSGSIRANFYGSVPPISKQVVVTDQYIKPLPFYLKPLLYL